ncbi:hypothetical protein J32TS6_37550 [Virgibacillus pantothenticus]|uniref:flagellar protein FlgN n=1 Tax=Virgibacillus pantothenticus TaxID=1473 RepID=UPI001B2BF52A|nr:flagellar protein FlgN [Virgibacillus pantothenticus]GIP65200.1 hypothetical protein J32TS6_37550 [Virgibacillus pantothenticus]
MSLQSILDLLERLLHLHMELIELAKKKTEVVKTGDVDTLSSILAAERKQIRKIEKAEKERQHKMAAWFAANQCQDQDHTVTTLLSLVKSGEEKEKLVELTTLLTKSMTELKQQEQLNYMLIQQSLQFVQFSLNVMNPSIQSVNYGTTENQTRSVKQSLFDSKV